MLKGCGDDNYNIIIAKLQESKYINQLYSVVAIHILTQQLISKKIVDLLTFPKTHTKK